jgi:hypothetical protein
MQTTLKIQRGKEVGMQHPCFRYTAVLMAMLCLVALTTNVFAAHPKFGETGFRGILFDKIGIPMVDNVGTDMFTLSQPVNGRYSGLGVFSLTNTCTRCHLEIVQASDQNRHSNLSSQKVTGRGYDPAHPWVQGPGMFGKWSPAYNRQLGDLKATYTSEEDLLAKLDLGVFGFTLECAVCHVGGTFQEINILGFKFPWKKVQNFITGGIGASGPIHYSVAYEDRFWSLFWDTLDKLSNKVPYIRRVPLNPWDYFVDSTKPAASQIQWGPWRKQGPLAIDCFICHLQGYSHLARNNQIIHDQNLAGAGVIGSGLATIDEFGEYLYDASLLTIDNGAVFLNATFTDRIVRYPAGDNCVHCHMPIKLVDQDATWKAGFYAYDAIPSDNSAEGNAKPARYLADFLKRGDFWVPGADVHTPFECGACHAQTGKYQAYDPTKTNYMHSPGKGHDPLQTASDEFESTVKYCEDCHVKTGNLVVDGVPVRIETYGAPMAESIHQSAGLLANIVPTAMRIKDGTGAVETFTGNHLDILYCTSCHVRKRYAAGRLFDFSTGAEFYNFVGSPLTTIGDINAVPLAFTWKENTAKKVINGQPNPEWRRRIYPFNYVTAKYWNNNSAVDANGDGFTTGMSNNGTIVAGDPFFLRTINNYFTYGVNPTTNNRIPTGLTGVPGLDTKTGWPVLSQEGGVTFTRPTEIAAFQTRLQSNSYYPQLVLEAEPYLLMHNVNSRLSSLGKKKADGSYGCSDCHGAAAGVFNGAYDLMGSGKDANNNTVSQAVSWNNATDVVTKALYWDRTGAQQSLSFSQSTADPLAPYATKNIQRWELLGYDAQKLSALNNMVPQKFGLGLTPQAIINAITDRDPVLLGTQIYVNEAVSLSAADAQVYQGAQVGSATYRWSFSDGSPSLTGQSVSKTFTTTGSKTIALTVVDEEGLSATSAVAVETVVPNPITITYNNVTKAATFSGLQMPNYRIRIVWGDGRSQFVTTYNAVTAPNGLPTVTVPKTYATPGEKTIQVYVLDIGGVTLGYNAVKVLVL